MREEDKLHFSPKYAFADIKFDNDDVLIEAFKDRVYGFYLEPARLLNQRRFGFGCGLLCAALIDSLARIRSPRKSPRDRIVEWLQSNIGEFNEELAVRFYEDFRCGLVHEGRIKNPGEFSYESRDIISKRDGIIIINPSLLLARIEASFQIYLKSLRENRDVFDCFRDHLRGDFEKEVQREE